MNNRRRLSVVSVLLAFSAGCDQPAPDCPCEDDAAAAFTAPTEPASLEPASLEPAPSTELKCDDIDAAVEAISATPDGDGLYIIDGDIPLIGLQGVRDHIESRCNALQPGRLIIHEVKGVAAKWSDTDKVRLRYCVSKTFGSRYDTVVATMASASAAWSASSGVRFEHVSSADGSCTATNGDVVFDVNPTSSGAYLARAFFPNYPRKHRNVMIDDSAFKTTGELTLEGILRHELGHVLGYRHEHTRAQGAAQCFEDKSWRPLTSYDPESVMHYPQCLTSGVQDWSLRLSPKDKQGARLVYGPPLP